MEFHILGPVGMCANGRAVDLRSVKVRGLLGILLLKANKVVGTGLLSDGLWDDAPPPVPKSTLQVYASRLRLVLKKAGNPATVITEDDGYRLEVDPGTIDYHRFLDLVRSGHAASSQSEHARAAECFEAAVDLWRRPPLATLKTSWAERQRETLTTRELLPAWSTLFEAKLELGDHEFVLTKLHSLLGEHSHDETLAQQWMRALAAVNRSAEIHSFFKDFTRRLQAELGTPPRDELVQLYHELTIRRETIGLPAPRVIGNWDLPADTPYFTGREDLLAQLDQTGRNACCDGRRPSRRRQDGTRHALGTHQGKSFPGRRFVREPPGIRGGRADRADDCHEHIPQRTRHIGRAHPEHHRASNGSAAPIAHRTETARRAGQRSRLGACPALVARGLPLPSHRHQPPSADKAHVRPWRRTDHCPGAACR
ncbi:DNA-binding SARP family transcriptional activator [Kibdelosporangium banguiense]|uniref:DNA-binding SARP family transcriptional activator n=1 Tax=Kibdelosporangium banguiense TaxID=1365924 RepID=A0ABS4T6G6_9PSEU|nr:DNA-binding SARP family transcriptional activator [Kibdelosporangium banguiense]